MAGPWYSLGFLDNSDHKDLKPGPAVGAIDPKVALKRREAEAMSIDDGKATPAVATDADKGTMSQASFSKYK